MIGFTHKGDFSSTNEFLKNLRLNQIKSIFEKYGKQGVAALSSATPVDTGYTASCWYYKIEQTNDVTRLLFCNSNVNQGVPIALILQYGHATGTGGWVEGRDYINPAIQPIFDQIVKEMWGEVTKL